MILALLLWPVKVGVIAAAVWYVLRDPLPAPADWIVAILAGVLLHLAYAAVMTDIRRGGDARLLQKAGLAQLRSGMKSSQSAAIMSFALAASLVGFILFAPWNAIRAVPGGSLIVDKQTERLKDALWKNDVREIAAASRYLDPNLAFEEASRTPLMLARSAAAAEVLIGRGASVTAHDENGYSVLMNVAERGSPELLTFLVGHGADVNEHPRADASTSVLSIAKDRNTAAAVEALVKAGARE